MATCKTVAGHFMKMGNTRVLITGSDGFIGSNREISMGDLFGLINTLMDAEAVISCVEQRRRPAMKFQ